MQTPPLSPEDALFLLIAGVIFFSLLSGSLIYFVFMYQRRQRVFEEEKAKREMAYRQALLQSQVEIREETLNHVSRELHDNIGQLVSVAKMNLLGMPGEMPEEARSKIMSTRDVLSDLYQEVKSLSVSLNGRNIFKKGLAGAIHAEAERINNTGMLKVTVSSSASVNLNGDKEIFLFRMCQEALSNVMQHARATEIVVNIQDADAGMLITIADNGQGFDPEKVPLNRSSGGNGLTNLAERAALIGGRFTIDSKQGKGTKLSFYIPQT